MVITALLSALWEQVASGNTMPDAAARVQLWDLALLSLTQAFWVGEMCSILLTVGESCGIL